MQDNVVAKFVQVMIHALLDVLSSLPRKPETADAETQTAVDEFQDFDDWDVCSESSSNTIYNFFHKPASAAAAQVRQRGCAASSSECLRRGALTLSTAPQVDGCRRLAHSASLQSLGPYRPLLNRSPTCTSSESGDEADEQEVNEMLQLLIGTTA